MYLPGKSDGRMSSPTFSQLLTQHMQRAGISDSELARAIGVQRQTIFRWKEGLVSRPRVREDILNIAQKLRLRADERDQLLLAAGFPPEVLTAEVVQYPPTLLTYV
jgi:transcriptional regulator with XRE-family HTH domain